MENWVGKVAVVTGVSSGIGKAITKELVGRGVTVVGLARRENLLQELSEELKECKGKFHYRVVDLKKEEDIVAAFNWIDETLGGISLLVNNAGLYNMSTLLDGKTEDWKEVLEVQILGMNICSREAVKNMKKREIAGIIININSKASQWITPVNPYVPVMYTVSKRAVTTLTEGLRLELYQQKSRIRVSSISPGLVRTEKVVTNAEWSKLPAIEMKDMANAVIYVITAPPNVEISELTIQAVGSSI